MNKTGNNINPRIRNLAAWKTQLTRGTNIPNWTDQIVCGWRNFEGLDKSATRIVVKFVNKIRKNAVVYGKLTSKMNCVM